MELIGSLELRVAELLHHIKIESAVVQGAKNVFKYLSGQKIQDRRILAEVAESACAFTFNEPDKGAVLQHLLHSSSNQQKHSNKPSH